MINYTTLKAAMQEAGYTVSAGAAWTVEDSKQYLVYCYYEWNGMSTQRALATLQYEGLAPEGFPGAVIKNVASVAITATPDTLTVGGDSVLTATATFDDSTTADVTAGTTFESVDPVVVSVDGSTATGESVGSSDITGTYDGVESPAVTITVTV